MWISDKESIASLLLCLLLTVIFNCCTSPETHSGHKADAGQKPDESYFEKIILDNNIDEPMELAPTPDGNVIFIERYGSVKMYHAQKRQTLLLGKIEVNALFSHGLLGLTIDPDFANTGWIYLFYSPAKSEVPVQRVSRFTVFEERLDPGSEEIILEIPVQRQYHGHDGGSLAFGAGGELYISVGDNTSPFFKESYTPLDERPGRAYFDAQRTSLNTNDLNGKILRIFPNPTGGAYVIPRGNLFPRRSAFTRPEIYAMGFRNPFRLSVDKQTGFVYVGNIGAVDELLQIRSAGLYGGWPYFYGNNMIYNEALAIKGPALDPQKPVNNSPNNTGLRELPACRPALLWYSDTLFPELGGFSGAKNIMTGPVYRYGAYPNASGKLPKYYDGKLFIYDWVRNWIMAVSLDEKHNYLSMEEFMPSGKFSHPIDMELGPDGTLYLLEYGASGYTNNADAKLVKIVYRKGNRSPVASVSANRTTGAVPLTVRFSAAASFDPDEKDVLNYTWKIDSRQIVGKQKEMEYTFTKPGTYSVELTVTDAKGARSRAGCTVKAGNEAPDIQIITGSNQSFWFGNTPINYQVSACDKEDGKLNAGIRPADVTVSFYQQNHAVANEDFVKTTEGAPHTGKVLLTESDCMACHETDKASVGPSFIEIATRYASDHTAAEYLARKIISGGGGNWPGGREMSAHPQLSSAQAKNMAEYILSLKNDNYRPASLPLSGKVIPNPDTGYHGAYVLHASYTDKGTPNAEPITGHSIRKFKSPVLWATDYDQAENVAKRSMYLYKIKHNSYVVFKNLDLTGIKNITYEVGAIQEGGNIELRLDSLKGRKISKAEIKTTGQPVKQNYEDEMYSAGNTWERAIASITPTSGFHDLYFVFQNKNAENRNLFKINHITFNNR